MKKQLLILCLLPLIGFSQTSSSDNKKPPEKDFIHFVLNEMKLYKSPVSDYHILSYVYSILIDYDSTTMGNSDISDMAYWFQRKDEFINYYGDFQASASLDDKAQFGNDSTSCSWVIRDRLNVWSIILYSTRAQLKFKKGDYNGAIEDWEKCTFEDKSTECSYYYDIGICYHNLSDENNACKYMSKAGELGCKDAYTFISNYCNFKTH